MDAPSRRSLLRASGPLVAALAGCSAFDSPGNSSLTDPPPDSPVPDPSELSHEGAVLEQATDTSPARVELRLTNESDHAVYPLPGAESSLLASVPRATGDTGELVCFPPDDDSLHAFGLSGQPVDGCWRFETADGEGIHIAVNAVARPTTRLVRVRRTLSSTRCTTPAPTMPASPPEPTRWRTHSSLAAGRAARSLSRLSRPLEQTDGHVLRTAHSSP